MKFSPIFALLAVCAPVVAHAQTMDAPMMDAPAVAAPVVPLPMAPKSAETSDAFVWRFAPPVGSRWTMRSFTRASSQTQTPAMGGQKAQSMNFSSIAKITADYDVLSRDALGATTTRITLREMTNDMTVLLDGKTIKSPLAKANSKAVDGATLTIKQSSDGKVWGVVGMRGYLRKIFKASGIGDDATVTQMLDANPMTNNSGMIKSLSMMSGTIPTSPVRVGESWTYDVALPAPLALEINGTRTLKKLDSEFAVVADSATYGGGKAQMKIPATPQMSGVNIDYGNMFGSITGTSHVQRSSGMPLETTLSQIIKGSISTQIPAMNGEPAQKITVPINMTSATRMVVEPR